MIAQNDLLNQNALEFLAKLNAKNSMAHAYLFIGSAFSGKKQTALAAAKMINCLNSTPEKLFCNQCPPCLKITAGSHPDVRIIEGNFKDTIKIDQARDLMDQIKLRPYEAKRKVFIITNVEHMTMEAANSLLKTLEEPPASSFLILTTVQEDKVLDTIKSRCHKLPFLSSSKTKLEAQLIKYYDVDALEAHFLAHFAEGCLGKAKDLNDSKFFKQKNDWIDESLRHASGNDFFKKISSEPEDLKSFLDVLLCWVHDALLMKTHVSERRIIHADRLRELKNFVGRFSFDELVNLHQQLVQAKNMLAENLNIKIPLLLIKEQFNG